MKLRRAGLLGWLLAAGSALGAVSVTAQSHNQNTLVGANGALLRLGALGVQTTITGTTAMAITPDADNRLAVFTGVTNSVYRVDLATQLVTTVWAGAPFTGSLEGIEVDQNGDYLVLDQGRGLPQPAALYRVDRSGASVTTVAPLTGLNPMGFVEDKMTGDWIVAEINGDLIRVDRDSGAITSVVRVSNGNIQGVTQDPHRSDLYVLGQINASVLRVDPQTGASMTISTGFAGSAISIDRAPAKDGSVILVGDRGGVVRRIRRDGIETTTVGGVLGQVWGLTIERSRNVATVLAGPPNDRQVVLDFPGDAGKPYVCALSVSGYTGGPRLSDGRVIPLRVDDLTLLTAVGSLAPMFTQNIGRLNPNGRATVRFNANPLGRAVQGVRVWIAALTIDAAASANISAISAPVLVVL